MKSQKMFQIGEMPPQIGADDIALLRQVETATVGHFLHTQFAGNEIRAVLPDVRVAGTAVTLRLPGADSTALHCVMDMLRPGDFLVIDRAGDRKHACWGGVITFMAQHLGAVGAVIDGPATDQGEIRKRGFPVWCTGPSPITTKILGLEGAINIPVSVGGTAVEPGDAVLADESGVLFLKPGQVRGVAERAIGMQADEVALIERLRNGDSLPRITGASQKVETKLAKIGG